MVYKEIARIKEALYLEKYWVTTEGGSKNQIPKLINKKTSWTHRAIHSRPRTDG